MNYITKLLVYLLYLHSPSITIRNETIIEIIFNPVRNYARSQRFISGETKLCALTTIYKR